MAIKINDILIEGGGTTHECEFTVPLPLFFNKLSILYFSILLYVEIYIPLVENYKYICRKLHIHCRKVKIKSFICRNLQIKTSIMQNISNLHFSLFKSLFKVL